MKCLRLFFVLHEKGLNVSVLSFDGQFAKEAFRGEDLRPLTIVQLMKDVWKESVGLSKSVLQDKMFSTNMVSAQTLEELKNQIEVIGPTKYEDENIINGPIFFGKKLECNNISMSKSTFAMLKKKKK